MLHNKLLQTLIQSWFTIFEKPTDDQSSFDYLDLASVHVFVVIWWLASVAWASTI